MLPLLLALTLIGLGWSSHNFPNAQLYNHRSNRSPNAFGLLSLRLREKSYCEGEKAAFKCPMHTHIAIDEVFYGHSARTAEICAGASSKKRTIKGRNGTKRKVDYNFRASSSTSNGSCEVPEALLFAMETCQNKRRCFIKTGAKDPSLNNCSQVGRHFQVSYRCRPSQFNGEFFCDNQLMSLSCLEGQRVAIHSAFYRSVPPKGSGNCRKTPADLYIDCSTDVLSIVAERCHARKACQLHVGPSLFHSSCPETVNKQLVVVFICVEEDVFTEEALARGQWDAEGLITEFDAAHEYVPTERMNDDQEEKLQTLSVESANWPASDSVSGDQPKYVLSKMDKFESEPPDQDAKAASAAAENKQRIHSVSPNLFGLLKALLIAWDHLMAHQQQAVLCLSLSAGLALLLVVVLGIVQSCHPESARCNDKNVQDNHRKLLVNEDGPVDVDLLDRNAVSFIRFANLTPPRSAVGANGTHFLP